MISLGVAAIIAAIIGAAASGTAAAVNYKQQQDTNAANAKAQAQVNAQNQYNTEHAHQIEMNDLAAAGLNPVLTATGGQGAPMATLNAPKAQSPQIDLSGVSTALNSMVHMMMMTQLVEARADAAEKSAEAKIASAQIGRTGRNEVADKYIAAGREARLHKYESEGKALLSSAKEVKKIVDDGPTPAEWKRLMRKYRYR